MTQRMQTVTVPGTNIRVQVPASTSDDQLRKALAVQYKNATGFKSSQAPVVTQTPQKFNRPVPRTNEQYWQQRLEGQGSLQPASESWRDKAVSAVAGLMGGDRDAYRMADKVAGVADFVPGVGDALGLNEAWGDLKRGVNTGDALLAGGAVLGGALSFVPGNLEAPVKRGLKGLLRDEAGTFGGRNAKTADLGALSRAESMAVDGADRTAIWNDTGWFKGVDGKWRFEIDDSGSSVNFNALPNPNMLRHRLEAEEAEKLGVRGLAYMDPADPARKAAHSRVREIVDAERARNIPVQEALNHPELQSAYDFGDLTVGINVPEGAEAAYYPELNNIGIRPVPLLPRSKYESDAQYRGAQQANVSPMAHEVQHHVQKLEEFARGGFPEMGADFRWTPESIDEYKRMAGEVEARAVQKRLQFTPELRKSIPPWRSYDVPEASQIIRFNP